MSSDEIINKGVHEFKHYLTVGLLAFTIGHVLYTYLPRLVVQMTPINFPRGGVVESRIKSLVWFLVTWAMIVLIGPMVGFTWNDIVGVVTSVSLGVTFALNGIIVRYSSWLIITFFDCYEVGGTVRFIELGFPMHDTTVMDKHGAQKQSTLYSRLSTDLKIIEISPNWIKLELEGSTQGEKEYLYVPPEMMFTPKIYGPPPPSSSQYKQ